MTDNQATEAEYASAVAAQRLVLDASLDAAQGHIARASRALFELIELEAPELVLASEGDDARAHLAAAAQALRAADRCFLISGL